MQDMVLGGQTIPVQWESFSDVNMALDTVGAALNGSLVVSSAPMPTVWLGKILISPDVPSYATVAQLEVLWLTKGPIAFIDKDGVARSVIIDSPMTVFWDNPMATFGLLPFKLIEVQT